MTNLKLGYKLVRKLKNGSLAPLFIGKKSRYTLGEKLQADCIPTQGFAVRKGFHITSEPIAPHLSKNGRVWVLVKFSDYVELKRPEAQGGVWFIAQKMTVLWELI